MGSGADVKSQMPGARVQVLDFGIRVLPPALCNLPWQPDQLCGILTGQRSQSIVPKAFHVPIYQTCPRFFLHPGSDIGHFVLCQ